MYSRKNIWTVTALIALILISVSVYLRFLPAPIDETVTITNFEECRNAGYPIMESYPEQCRTPDGSLFVNTLAQVETELENIDEHTPSSTHIDPVIPNEKSDQIPTKATTSTQQLSISPFDTPITYRIGDTKRYKYGKTVILKEVKDSRCKDGVQCVWAGELTPMFILMDDGLNTPLAEINIGTVTNQVHAGGGLRLTLINATEDTATIKVSDDDPKFPIKVEDKSCTVDSDCAPFVTTCGSCSYETIDKSSQNKLNKEFAAFCAINPPLVMCDMVPTGDVSCINNMCQ
jgi:hypothetical protein